MWTRKSERSGKARIISVTAAVLVLYLVAMIVTGCTKEQEPGLLETLEGYKGYTRQVGTEEYQFFEELVLREQSDEMSEEEKVQKVKEYINSVNAVFYLGEKLGLCEPYSFGEMKLRMEQENASRKAKKESGEPIYGLEQFEADSYFRYVFSSLEADIKEYLTDNADDALIADAREHYEKHPEEYEISKVITYTVEEGDDAASYTVPYEKLSGLQNADGELFDFLTGAAEGDTFEYSFGDSSRRVSIVSVETEQKSFEENTREILSEYIGDQVYDSLIEKAAQNNPVEFQ